MSLGNAGEQRLTMRHFCWFLVVVSVSYGAHLRLACYLKTIVDSPIRADAADYYQYAKNLAESRIFSRQSVANPSLELPRPDAVRSPGFPYFASLFFASSPTDSLRNTLLAQTVLQTFSFGLMTILLIRLLGLRWSLPGIFLLWTFPHFVSINTYYLSESLFTSLLALFIVLFWYVSKDDFRSTPGAVACGLVLGLAWLVRPVVEFLPWLLLLCFVVRAKKSAVVFFASAMLPIIAWKVRNLLVLGAPSDSLVMYTSLYHGSFVDFMYEGDKKSLGIPYRFDPREREIDSLQSTLRVIFERASASPREYLNWYLFGKQTFLWRWDILAGFGDIFIYPVVFSPYFLFSDMQFSHALNKIIHPFWVNVGLLSAFLLIIRMRTLYARIAPVWLAMALIVVYAALVHAVLAPFPRYGIPFKLFLIPLSIYAIKGVFEWLGSISGKRQSP